MLKSEVQTKISLLLSSDSNFTISKTKKEITEASTMRFFQWKIDISFSWKKKFDLRWKEELDLTEEWTKFRRVESRLRTSNTCSLRSQGKIWSL